MIYHDMTPEQLFLANLPLIERIIGHVCRRHRLSREEAQDFVSLVKVKLIENNYAILHKFKGRSSLSTYLTIRDRLSRCL